MQIEQGKLYENRTWLYLYPVLKNYGKELTDFLSSFFKVAIGIDDGNIKDLEGRFIFILVDTKIETIHESANTTYRQHFSKFLDWVKEQSFYERDYLYNNTEGKEQHMIVLKIPEQFYITFDYFIKGEYSKMYKPEEIKTFFGPVTIKNKDSQDIINNKLHKVRGILNKSVEFLNPFVTEVNKRFATKVESFYFKDAELDFPPFLDEEIFNYEEYLWQKNKEEIDLILEKPNGD